jgi:filamentous hemagglutinin
MLGIKRNWRQVSRASVLVVVQFNDGNVIGATANFTFDKATSLLTVNGLLSVTGNASIGGNLDLNTSWINNVGYPNLATDAATKLYVDNMVSTALAYHEPVLVSTTTDLDTATGGTVSYNNGASGVGANLTTTGTFLLIDGANVQTVGTRILVKNEANAAWNGVYEYTSTTVITRTTDADEYGPDSSEQLSINDYFFTTGGVVNEGHAFVVNSPAGTITFGTSNITFALFSQSQVYDAGTGIAITGTTISTTANQSHVTAVGTLTSLSVSGNANIGNIGTAGLITATGNLNAGNIITAGIVTATGNGTFGNIDTAGLATVTGNITGGNIITGGVVTATGNITGANLITSGVLTVTGNANIGNIGTGGLILATGNITGGNLITGGVVTATGNVSGANLVASYGVNTPNLTANTNIDFSGAGNVFLGNVSNLHITGGSADQVLKTDGAGNLSWSSGSILANGYSNVSIPAANGNVVINANSGVDQQWNFDTTGNLTAPSGGNIIATGNIFAPAIVQNASTYDTRIELGSSSGIIAITSNGNSTQFSPAGIVTLGGASEIQGGTFGGSALVLGTAQTDLKQLRGGNVTIQVGTGGTTANTWTFAQDGSFTSPGNITATISANVGNTRIGWGTTTTSNIDANQTIAEFSTTGITAIEFLVKGEDSTGDKYSVATVTAVTDGTTVDYATYATAFLTAGTGVLAVNVSGGNVALQVTPSSSNSTVWTTQYRLI